MLILRGAPALSAFRHSKLLEQLSQKVPAVTGLYAEFAHFADVTGVLTADERAEAMRRLHAIPRDASPTRLRNRDSIDGRPRAFNRKFGLSRINLREKAHRGELPGVVKSSW